MCWVLIGWLDSRPPRKFARVGMLCANKLARSLSSAPPGRNAFKQALKAAAAAKTLPELQAAGSPLLGLWASAGSPQVTELVALEPGLSWLVIDMEHAPNTLPSVLAQLHAAQAASAEAMVRVPCANDPVIVKQVRRARLHPHLHPRPGA